MRSGAWKRAETWPLDSDRDLLQQTIFNRSERAEESIALRAQAESQALDPAIAAYESLLDRLCQKKVR